MKLRQRAAVALVTVASTAAVTGCSVFSPAIVLQPYDPSDGRNTRVGGVDVRNALIVSAGVDQPGVLSVVMVNSSDEDASVTVSADVDAGEAPAQTFFIPAGGSVHIGDPTGAEGTQGAATAAPTAAAGGQLDGWLQIPQVPVLPGQTVPVTFRASGQSAEVPAPVLLPCFEYAQLTPTAAPDAAPSPSASPSVSCGPETDDSLQQADEGEGGEGTAATGDQETQQEVEGGGADTQGGGSGGE